MKVQGKSLVVHNTATVKVVRPDGEFLFTIKPLPFGWSQLMRIRGVFDPIPRKREPLKDAKGLLVKDPETKLVEMAPVADDPDYEIEVYKQKLRLQALKFREHLKGDSTVEFETPEPTTNDKAEWRAYAEKLLDEIEGVGLTEVEVVEVLNLGYAIESRVNAEAVLDLFLRTRKEAGARGGEESSATQSDSDESQQTNSES